MAKMSIAELLAAKKAGIPIQQEKPELHIEDSFGDFGGLGDKPINAFGVGAMGSSIVSSDQYMTRNDKSGYAEQAAIEGDEYAKEFFKRMSALALMMESRVLPDRGTIRDAVLRVQNSLQDNPIVATICKPKDIGLMVAGLRAIANNAVRYRTETKAKKTKSDEMVAGLDFEGFDV